MTAAAKATAPRAVVKRRGRTLAKVVASLLWGFACVFVVATALEGLIFLKYSNIRKRDARDRPDRPEYWRLHRAYEPFAIQHLNPYYFFFYPLNKEERGDLGNEVCSIGPEGFRGPGPEAADGRKLAFVLGGSSAFGHFSSSNETTITGHLNRLQDEYLFVNAGVPSWKSLQELNRLALQILDYGPDLVITYDGSNDATGAAYYWDKGCDYPAGTPESFDKLHSFIDDLRGKPTRPRVETWSSRLFPRLTRAVRARLAPRVVEPRSSVGDLDSVMVEWADRYVANLTHIQTLTHAAGARFVAVFQPVVDLHQNAPSAWHSHPVFSGHRLFRDRVFASPDPLVEHLDYSTFFESLDRTLPCLGGPEHPDLSDDVIFVDQVHLTDRGNRMVAEELLTYLRSVVPLSEGASGTAGMAASSR